MRKDDGDMDGLDGNRQDPVCWAADVIIDHIDEGENGIPSSGDVEAILGSIKDFLEASFEEEQLKMPSDAEIVNCAMERVQE